MKSKESLTNLGIIGLGNIGVVHADVLREPANRTGLVLVAVADPSPKTKYPDVKFYPSYPNLLQDDGINAVTITTPPNTHYSITIDSLDAGKNVLVEKPPALRIEQLEEMAKTAKKREVVLFTSFHTCYRPEVEAASKELKGKAIKEIKITYKEDPLRWHNMETGWVFEPKISGGGYLIDSGINAMSVVVYILPESAELKVQDAEFTTPSGLKVETLAHVDFTFGENGRGTIDMEWMYKGREVRQIVIRTEADEYLIDIVQGRLSKNGIVISGDEKSTREIADAYLEYRGVYADFAAHLASGTSCVRTKELRFVLDAYRLKR